MEICSQVEGKGTSTDDWERLNHLRQHSSKQMAHPYRKYQPGRSTHKRKQNAFGQQLSKQSRATRSECPSHCNFMPTHDASRHQHIRQIGAGNQQDECDYCHQQRDDASEPHGIRLTEETRSLERDCNRLVLMVVGLPPLLCEQQKLGLRLRTAD